MKGPGQFVRAIESVALLTEMANANPRVTRKDSARRLDKPRNS
jgi:hypothetical protein